MTATALATQKPFERWASMPRAGHIKSHVQHVADVIAVLAWNVGPEHAYEHLVIYYGRSRDYPSISREIESRAFDGTLYADVFNLLCEA